MIDRYEVGTFIRIIGIILSLTALTLVFIKPFEYTTNTTIVYTMLLASAGFVIIGQLFTIYSNAFKEEVNQQKRHEAVYDVITTSVVMALFAIIYVIPFLIK